jgi:hypothetical protein
LVGDLAQVDLAELDATGVLKVEHASDPQARSLASVDVHHLGAAAQHRPTLSDTGRYVECRFYRFKSSLRP